MSTFHSSLPVLVIGGGPAGLTAALTLVKNDIPVRIVEKLPAFHNASRGTGIHPRSLEVFRFLGLSEDFNRIGRPPPMLRAYKLPGGTEPVRTWSILDPLEPTPDRPEYRTLMLGQYQTEGILRDHLDRYGVGVEVGTEVVALAQEDGGESVKVTMKKRSAEGEQTMETGRFAYVIGADGARGVSRKAIGATFEGQTKDGDGQVWADVVLEGATADFWHTWAVPGRYAILLRPKDMPGAFHIGVVGVGFDPVDLLDPTKLVHFFHEETGRKEIVFREFASMTYWKPKMRMVNKFSDRRIFLAGDAAHVHSPTGGQGLNTSVQDSFNIAWKIALVHKGFALASLLATYDAERLPVVTHMLLTTSNLYTHGVAKTAEDVPLLASAGPAFPPTASATSSDHASFLRFNDRALRQLEINYRWSPVVFDARGFIGLDAEDLKARAYVGHPGDVVRAGDRAPDAPALVDASGRETSLFAVLKPNKHTVLVFSHSRSGSEALMTHMVDATRRYPQGTVQVVVLGSQGVPEVVEEGVFAFHDTEGHAARAYSPESQRSTAVVVRPDGYVGAYAYDVAGLKTYFSNIFHPILSP